MATHERSHSPGRPYARAAVLWLLAAAVPFIVATIRCKPHNTSHGVTPPVRTVADVKQLMSGLIDPGADVVWESMGTVVTKAGAEEHRPRTDAEWQAVRNAALQLTEGGNLLMLGDRAKDRETWWRMSRALVDAGAIALAAAERKNAEALGARIEVTNGINIAVERSLYWNANGIFWSGGTNALATPLP